MLERKRSYVVYLFYNSYDISVLDLIVASGLGLDLGLISSLSSLTSLPIISGTRCAFLTLSSQRQRHFYLQRTETLQRCT